ncbi:Sas10 C-terminal domain-containing protein [Auriculariales sp. MPI-PUGE-AT-0066]|nr:Sas10 C-terminal domain-containing protein [Auriculariales sp. MPI-PUGE-AT-0066]
MPRMKGPARRGGSRGRGRSSTLSNGRPKGGPRSNKGSTSVARWERDQDIPMDGLEDYEEVFALDGVNSDDSDDDERDGIAADEDEGGEDHLAPASKDKKSKSKPKSTKDKAKKSKSKPKDSDEESEEDADASWGTKKSAYYAGGDDEPDSDAEAEELHAAEARRVQMKARAGLTDDDFGLHDLRLDDVPASAESGAEPAVELELELDADGDPAAVRVQLAQTYPETLALAREWDDALIALAKAETALEKVRAANPDATSLGLVHVHHQTLLAYTTTLAFYFHLCARTSPGTVRKHPILGRLVTLKQALATMEELDFAPDDDEEETDISELSADVDKDDNDGQGAGWRELELRELLRDAEQHGDVLEPKQRKSKTKTKAKSADDDPASTRTKTKKKTKAPQIVFDLEQPEFVSSQLTNGLSKAKTKSNKAKTQHRTDEDEAFGDATMLGAGDASDKARRRKTLKFHAARIESAADRRAAARAGAGGGDEDVPYPERKREMEMRKQREFEKRLAKQQVGQGGADLDDEEPTVVPKAHGKKRVRDEEDEEGDAGSDADGYYELVASRGKDAKKAKHEAYEAERAAERYNPDNEAAHGGPRALTRAILNNKGLTPHRSKSVRNPRVKKRIRYDKAKKRVASQKAIYKGGSEGSSYGGERSGITRVVKSTRLGS